MGNNEKRIIRVTSCDDCPYCRMLQPTTPGIYAVSCSMADRCETVVGLGFPNWCPLEATPDSKRIEKGGFSLPGFLRRQAE